MTHSKLDIDSILPLFMNDEYQIKIAKQALLEAFEQSLNTIIGEDVTPMKMPSKREWETYSSLQQTDILNRVSVDNALNNLRASQRNEAIKVIRGEK